jgi:hypothetical protein
MSDTDIYKNRETVQMTSDDPRFSKKQQRRRSSKRDPFDDPGDRRRRSKNSGLRRLLHLSRKSGNEKSFWVNTLIVIVVTLALIGIWQFWYQEYVAQEQSKKNELLLGQENAEASAEAEVQASAPAE